MREFSRRSGILFLLLLSACHTVPVFAPRESLVGKLLWKTPSRSLVFDAVIQYGTRNSVRIILSKETSSPVLIVTRNASVLDVQDRFQGRHWRGSADHPPAVLSGWAVLAETLLQASGTANGTREIQPAAGWSATCRIQNGNPRELNLASKTESYRLVLQAASFSPTSGR